jgi:hypothetical protein
MIPFKKINGLNVSYAGWRQRRREEERSVTHAHRQATEKESLSVSGQRGIRSETQTTLLDLVGNPDDLAKSCRKPTHTGVGLTDLALHLQHSLPSSRSRRSVEIPSPV